MSGERPATPAASTGWSVPICALAGLIVGALAALLNDGWAISVEGLLWRCAAAAALFAAVAALRNRFAATAA